MFNYAINMIVTVAALLPTLAAGVGATDTTEGTAVVPATDAVAKPVTKGHPAGSTQYRLESDGIERRYLMYLPKTHAAGTPLPVVFDFHGSGSDPHEEMRVTGMAEAAERHGFLLLMPFAAVEMPEGGHTWNVPPDDRLPNDVRLAADVLDHAAERVPIDQRRIYAVGFSGGARLASELACAMPTRIAALGAVGGLRAPASCSGSPVPVVAFHGTEDPINPYGGGGPDYWTYGVDAAASGWAARNGCDADPIATQVSASVIEQRYAACQGTADVVLYRIEGGGHTWPGSDYPFPEERFGALESGLDATELMLRFFAERPAPAPTTPSTARAHSGRGIDDERLGIIRAARSPLPLPVRWLRHGCSHPACRRCW